MDNVQKAGVIVVPVLIAVVAVIVLTSIDWGSAGPAVNIITGKCDKWSDEIDDMSAELKGRENSLGGGLDLDGSVHVLRNQYNLEVDRYNLECANTETHYFEENS